MNQAQLNGVRVLAKQCIDEHKKSGRKMNNAELKRLVEPYREKAKLLGCSDIYFSYIMGILNGVVRDR